MADCEPLRFLMGEHEVLLPADRRYSTIHLWLQPLAAAPQRYRVGLTGYSVRLLRDVYFLDWQIDAGTAVRKKQKIGDVESSKAVSDLYSPADGVVHAFNDAVLADPALINTDPYESGWLFELSTADATLSPDEYLALLVEHWPKAQREIKGQITRG